MLFLPNKIIFFYLFLPNTAYKRKHERYVTLPKTTSVLRQNPKMQMRKQKMKMRKQKMQMRKQKMQMRKHCK